MRDALAGGKRGEKLDCPAHGEHEPAGIGTHRALRLDRHGNRVETLRDAIPDDAILRADRVDEMLNAGEGTATVFPLHPHAGDAPKRVIVQISKTAPGPSRTLAGLVLHLPDGKPTPEAEAVLRHAAALSLA